MPRYLYDVKLHGFNRRLLISEFKEKYAHARFKHAEKTLETSCFGLFLKEKGVKYSELYSEKWSWHTKTAMSFFGVFGYKSIKSHPLNYKIMFY